MKNSRKFLLTSIALTSFFSVFLGIGIINDDFLNAQEKNTFTQKNKIQPFFKSGQTSLISQRLITFAYNCTITLEQTNTAPPTVNYRSSLSCTVGVPVGFVLGVYNANVNFPENRRYIGLNNFTCSLGASCTTPTYSRIIDRTQHLRIVAGVNIRGSDGIIYTENSATQTWRTYNNRGVGYPLIKPTCLDMSIVPFPGPPFVDYVPRDADFRSGLTQIYTTNRWVIPTDGQAHHIKPIAWGGSNDPQTNGVFLGPTTHQLFTTWWASFSNLNW